MLAAWGAAAIMAGGAVSGVGHGEHEGHPGGGGADRAGLPAAQGHSLRLLRLRHGYGGFRRGPLGHHAVPGASRS